ncbi:armadillo repeat-containing protein 7 isoform X2 [Lagenorhynchus albirostris]|uniref:armadillo repeat-containing protein 7 isoform X2 n=1 Tax=Lagenorhynchus albirostris TaxID=27610 RepID=UPI0028E19A24|nr:armadillo repeat-containing protein 7 isoform X2 [Lagenorhynchus albirostris]
MFTPNSYEVLSPHPISPAQFQLQITAEPEPRKGTYFPLRSAPLRTRRGPGGLCNLCSDRANKEHILQTGGVPLIIDCLSSPNEETVLSAVTTIMYLSSPGSGSHPELTATPVVQCMVRFSLSANARLRNLAQIFLEDFCSPSQVAEARSRRAHSALGIPLPRTEAPQQP